VTIGHRPADRHKPGSESMTPLEMLGRLVAFDTTSSKSNLELIDFVSAYLAELSVAPRLVHNEEKTKANLWATVGPQDKPGVVLSGHTDVVPVTGQPWTSDPFELTERDGRYQGRGTADMKAFLAMVLCALPGFIARRPRRPIHIAFSYDEEVGCLGARRLLSEIPLDAPTPEFAVIGEPTDFRIANTHKGIRVCKTHVTGRDAHSSAPHLGRSAISAAVRLIAYLDGLATEKSRDPDRSLPFEPPWTTLNVGMIEGGTAYNIIPRECRFAWEYRPVPGDDPAAIRERFEKFVDEQITGPSGGVLKVELEEVADVPALAADPSADSAVKFVQAILGDFAPPRGVSFTTEAGLFQMAGVPTVVCGPGSIDQAHRPDESITASQLERGTRFVEDLCARIATWEGT
ncbi:MAG: acetylornithine deacetylase, partial [Woeseiaceae bacterium]